MLLYITMIEREIYAITEDKEIAYAYAVAYLKDMYGTDDQNYKRARWMLKRKKYEMMDDLFGCICDGDIYIDCYCRKFVTTMPEV